MKGLRHLRRHVWQAVLVFAGACVTPAISHAQSAAQGATALPPVAVTAQANRDPVEKSYRKMIRGMDLYERLKARLAPDSTLRFRLWPRKRDTDMARVELNVLGSTVETEVPLGADGTFTLQRDARAWDEDAQVTPNRRRQSMTWRTDIRTPGLPPNTRRLGDMRLECQVGMEAGLVSNDRSFLGRMVGAMLDSPAYCGRPVPHYLFFADRPVFSVTLVAGARRQVLSIDMLYAGASEDPGLPADLPYCDCEVLLDRTFYLPLGDTSWPDDTLVEIEFMQDAAAPTP